VLKRVVLLLALLVPLAWLGASAFVALHEPSGLRDTTLVLVRRDGERPRWELAHPPPPAGAATVPLSGWADGIRGSCSSSMTTADGVERGSEYFLARGVLDPSRGTFPLAVGFVFWGTESLRSIRIDVTRDRDWPSGETPEAVAWEEVGTIELRGEGNWQWGSIEGDMPAGAVAWRHFVTREDGGGWATGQTLPRSRGRLDRLVEDLAAYGVFRWLAPEPVAEDRNP